MEVFDVFISYRRKGGGETARALFNYLKKRGLRPFLDIAGIPDGKYFNEVIADKLKAAPHYVLIGSADAFALREDEDWVREEMILATDEKEKNSDERTVTVIVPDGVTVPDTLNNEKADRILKAQRIPLRFGKDDADAFERVFDVVTEVNRVNIWHAAHRWYENSKQKGGRFARLDIVETVIPDVTKKYEKTEFPIDVKLGKEGEKKGLLDAIKEEKGDLYLIGQGGIGKTTALMKIMENAYKEPYTGDTQIPVFIELSFAPDSDGEGKVYENGRSTFIKRSVYKQISDRRSQDQGAYDGAEEVAGVFGLDPDIAVKPIRDLFTKESPSPEYLLLLDGLNEVSDARIKNGSDTVASLVVGEIKEIIEKCPNVRVILTSRTDETAIPFDGVRRLYLEGVSDGNTEKYLSEKKIPQKEIARIKKDASLWETLHIPLFLTIYADLTEREGISTQGEILRCFFHERRRNIYTQQQRIAEVGTNFYSSEGAVEAHLNSDMLNFIIDLIIPELAYEMEKNGEFYVSRKQIRDTLAAVLESRGDRDVLGVYGDDVFQITLRGGGRTAPSEIADDIIRIFGKNFNKTAENAVHALVYSLGIMQKTDNRYGFLHQHFRDYFAAVRYLNTVKLASAIFEDGDGEAALPVSNEAFYALPLKMQIRRFIGEIAGEHHNKPYCENKTWGLPEKAGDSLIMKALDIYRGVGHKVAGYAVYSLVHILNEARGELSGCDLSRLDFSECNLNGMRLSRKNLPAVFKGAVLHGKNLNYEGHTSIINSIFYSPDGKRILTSSGDGTAKIWDASTLQVIGTLKGHTLWVKSASYSPDGKRIVTASNDNTAKVWDAERFELLKTIEGHTRRVMSASYSPDGKRIVTVSCDKTAKVWDAESFELLGMLEGHTLWVKSASYSPDGKRIVTASCDKTAKVWDAESFELLGTLEGHTDWVNSASYSPDGKRIVTASHDKTAKVWDAESFELLGTLEGHTDWVNSASYSPDGKRIVTASYDNTAKIWDAERFELLETIEGEFAAFSPDGRHVVTAGGASIKIYETEKYSLVEKADGAYNAINAADLSPDGKRIVTALYDKTAKVWDAERFELLGTLEGHTDWVNSASYSPDGKRIVTASYDKTAKVWDAERFELLGTLEGHTDWVNSASYSPDGKRIVTASYDKTAKVWDAERFELLETIEGHTGNVYSASYSPDGKRIVTASRDKTAKVWDAERFELLGTLEGHEDWVRSVSYSPDGKRIVTASYDKTAKVWDAERFELLGTLEGHTLDVNSASYSPDGKRIVAASYDESAKIWNAENFDLLGTLKGHRDCVNSARYSADGSLIITASRDGTAKIWDAETDEFLRTLTYIPGMNFVGVDFTALDPRSEFDEEDKKLIRRYGGKK